MPLQLQKGNLGIVTNLSKNLGSMQCQQMLGNLIMWDLNLWKQSAYVGKGLYLEVSVLHCFHSAVAALRFVLCLCIPTPLPLILY